MYHGENYDNFGGKINIIKINNVFNQNGSGTALKLFKGASLFYNVLNKCEKISQEPALDQHIIKYLYSKGTNPFERFNQRF